MTSAPRVVRLQDYAPPAWLVDEADLDFSLDPRRTRVRARLTMRRNPQGGGEALPPLVLDGEGLEPEAILIDSEPLPAEAWRLEEGRLVIPRPPAEGFTLETETRIDPQANTALSGLYRSGGNYCTQCEAEGFRRITFWPDRPDVLARFTVRMEADAQSCPVLLSNGECVERGKAPGGRHYAVWRDPFPKPCYLFALVAGDLGLVEDGFTTMSGRKVALRIWVEKGKEERAGWAMECLKAAMAWDERRFGREYDLGEYNIVAVSDFNMGAMENKSLNIFNDKYVLADPQTASDKDHEYIEAVIGHEYFHNWTGNRITCRDWFQLCLKEGLTVFRDQEFTSDIRSRAVKRIEDVRNLRARQFPEDSGPLAHPVRPDHYAAIDNFYTATVYEKGAEVVRILHTLLGEETFMRGMEIYFSRFDGCAATVEDFVSCMEEASGRDLAQFMLWYVQAGTPHVAVAQDYDEEARALRLTITQSIPDTPGQKDKKPQHIPLKVALLGRDGRAMDFRLDGRKVGGEGLLELREKRQGFVLEEVAEAPVLSINRGFSAPVMLQVGQEEDELLFLLARDDDAFNRWEAGQRLARRLVMEEMKGGAKGLAAFADALGEGILRLREEDPAFLAEMLRLPGVNALAVFIEGDIDPQAIHEARRRILSGIGRRLEEPLRETFAMLEVRAPYAPHPDQAGRRAARAAILELLVHGREEEGAELAWALWQKAQGMSERATAMNALGQTRHPLRERALEDFIARFGDDHLMVDKWFSWQAVWPFSEAVEAVRALMEDGRFTLTNPNRVRALVGAFAAANPVAFARADGAGFALVAEAIGRLDAINPQVAARLAGSFRNWRGFEPERRERAREALEKLAAMELSKDLRDILTRTLETA